jgi:nitrilase
VVFRGRPKPFALISRVAISLTDDRNPLTQPSARYSLMAQGEQLHISTWPAVWPTRRPAATKATSSQDTPQPKQYNNLAANRTRTAAHCFEAKCFGVMCAGYMDKTMRDTIISHTPSAAETLDSLTQGESCFIDPTGAQVGESVQGEEGIAYATLDLNECVEPKQFHDVVGYYQRFDVFDLKVDRRARGVEGMFVDEDVTTDEGKDGTRKKDGGKS